MAELTELQQTLYGSRNPTRRWLHRSRLERVSAAVREAAQRGATDRALEVGPGAGPYLDLLCDLYTDVVASDIESEFLRYLAGAFGGRSNLSLLEDDITASALEPESFDLILCSEVLEHIPDPGAALDGIASLLRPGGALVLSTPQPYSTVELLGRVAFWPGVIQLARVIYREPVLPPGHISLLGRRRLGAMLADRRLTVRESDVGGLYLPGLAELGGEAARGLEQRLEGRLRRRAGRSAGALWTQYWVAERSAEG